MRKSFHTNKVGNIAKIKYFLPNSSNRQSQSQQQQNPLTKIKRSLNKKYSATSSYNNSHSNSKLQSKRQSKNNIILTNSEICLNQQQNQKDMSFEIVGIRDGDNNYRNNLQGYKRSIQNKSKSQKKFQYPLNQRVENNNNGYNNEIQLQKNKKASQYIVDSNLYQSTVRELSKTIRTQNNVSEMLKKITTQKEKKEFQQFLSNLKNDQNYQNIISMFTIMYFYEQRATRKI